MKTSNWCEPDQSPIIHRYTAKIAPAYTTIRFFHVMPSTLSYITCAGSTSHRLFQDHGTSIMWEKGIIFIDFDPYLVGVLPDRPLLQDTSTLREYFRGR